MLIGASAVMLLLLNGRIAGISGIVGRLAQGVGLTTNLAFVLGLLLGPLAYLSIFDGWPTVEITVGWPLIVTRSEEHTSELQSLMRISYAVFCLKKKNTT